MSSIITNINSQFPTSPTGGSSFSILNGVVDTYDDLPEISLHLNQVYGVKLPSGAEYTWLGLRKVYKYPAGTYYGDPNTNTWELTPFNVRLSEDSMTLVNVTDWVEFFNFTFDIKIGDRLIYNDVEYRNLTGAYTTTAPDTDTTNWGFPLFHAIEMTTTTDNPNYKKGLVFYDNFKNAVSYYNENNQVTVNMGQEVLFPVVNNSGGTINNGDVVTPDAIGIVLADRHIKERSRLIAVATTTMLDGESGYVCRLGQVGGLDTSLYTAGQILYLGNNGEYDIEPPLDGAYSVIVGVVDVVDTLEGIITVDTNISENTVEVTDTNGYPVDQRTGTTMSVDAPTRTFTIAPTGSDFHFYERGNKYEKYVPDSVVFTDEEGVHWIYYEDGVLTATFEPTIDQIKSIIVNNAFTSIIYWNATDKKVEIDICDERHGISMSGSSHIYNHITRGAQWVFGFTPSDVITDETGDLDAHAQFSIGAGEYFDEDMNHINTPIPVGGTIPVFYNTGIGVNIRSSTQTGFAVLNASGGRLYYNQNIGGTWQLTEVPNNNFVLYHIFGFNGIDVNTVSIMGQSIYATVSAARAGVQEDISSIIGGLDFPEMIPIASFIFQTSDGYANSVKARIRTTEAGEPYVDWRVTERTRGSAPTSHNNLTDLELAGLDITWGHINNLTQNIYGEKTFMNATKQRNSVTSHHFQYRKTYEVAVTSASQNVWVNVGTLPIPNDGNDHQYCAKAMVSFHDDTTSANCQAAQFHINTQCQSYATVQQFVRDADSSTRLEVRYNGAGGLDVKCDLIPTNPNQYLIASIDILII